MRKQTLLLIVTVLSLAAFLPALQSGVGGGGQSNIGGGGGGTPGGANTQLQFNNNGLFGGLSQFLANTPVAGDFQVGPAPNGTPSTNGILTVLPANAGSGVSIKAGGGGAVALLHVEDGAGNVLLNANTAGNITVPAIVTVSNCSSSASPAVCGSAAAGSVVIAAAATTITVNTTAVTANSQILFVEDDSLGTKLTVTCNTTSLGATKISARTGGTSFTITTATAPTTNPSCLSYWIVN